MWGRPPSAVQQRSERALSRQPNKCRNKFGMAQAIRSRLSCPEVRGCEGPILPRCLAQRIRGLVALETRPPDNEIETEIKKLKQVEN